MKKFWILLMACLLILTAGCNKKAETAEPTAETTEATVETTLPPETTEETVPVPQTTCGTARVENTPALLATRMRGDVVDVVGEYDDSHYVIKTDEGYGLVRKEMLRMEGEEAYETWTGYAYWHAEFYTDLSLGGEPAQKLATNTKVEVLDDLGYCYVVKVDDAVGFIKPNRISKWRFSSGSSSDDEGGGGSGGGANVKPIAFLVVSNGNVRLLPVGGSQSAADKIIDIVPEMMDKLNGVISNFKSKKKSNTTDSAE